MTTWSEHVIWWQLHPISFVGAEPLAPSSDVAPGHRLGRIEAWLGYMIELGCNGLALGPIFASQSHGYDTVDHYLIDPRLGTGEDFDQLVAACQQRGIKVLLDGVFNHVGRGFPQFQDVLRNGAASPYASWFRLDFDGGGPDGFAYADFEGHRNLVALNHDEPAVVDYVVEVMSHWLARGVAGWRLDAAYAVPPEFWHAVTSRVRHSHPQAWFLGEVIHGDYAAIAADGGLDSITEYELWKSIWSSLNDRNFFELSWTLGRHDGFAEAFLPVTFVGNHDVTRLASKLDNIRHLSHALAILFTTSGSPSIYAGDEQAFRGVKYDRVDGDAEIRPEFPLTPKELSPLGWPVYRLHQDLIGLRRRNPWLIRSRSKVIHLANETFAFHATDPDGGPGLAVLLNVSDHPFAFSLPAASARLVLGSDDGPSERVGPHGWAILELPA
jgi:cyclomaltodextrinase